MKKIVWIMVVALILLAPISLMAGCANNDDMLLQCDDENFGKYNGKAVEGLSAYDLIMEAYENTCADVNYTKEEYFCFN